MKRRALIERIAKATGAAYLANAIAVARYAGILAAAVFKSAMKEYREYSGKGPSPVERLERLRKQISGSALANIKRGAWVNVSDDKAVVCFNPLERAPAKAGNYAGFFIDLEQDKFARPALISYAISCQNEFPELSRSVFKIVEGMK